MGRPSTRPCGPLCPFQTEASWSALHLLPPGPPKTRGSQLGLIYNEASFSKKGLRPFHTSLSCCFPSGLSYTVLSRAFLVSVRWNPESLLDLAHGRALSGGLSSLNLLLGGIFLSGPANGGCHYKNKRTSFLLGSTAHCAAMAGTHWQERSQLA